MSDKDKRPIERPGPRDLEKKDSAIRQPGGGDRGNTVNFDRPIPPEKKK